MNGMCVGEKIKAIALNDKIKKTIEIVDSQDWTTWYPDVICLIMEQDEFPIISLTFSIKDFPMMQ